MIVINRVFSVFTQTEGADVDAAAADTCQAANGEEEGGLRKEGGHQATDGVNTHTHQEHRTLPIPAQTRDHTVSHGFSVLGFTCVSVCVFTGQIWLRPPEIPAADPP